MNDSSRPQSSLRTSLLIGTVFALAYAGYDLWQAKQQSEALAANPPAVAAAPSASSAAGAPLSEAARAARKLDESRFTVTTDDYVAVFTDLNAALRSFGLRDGRYRTHDGEPMDIVSTDREEYLPLALELRGITIPADARWTGEQLSERSVRFTLEADGFRVVRDFEAGDTPFVVKARTSITNLSRAARPVRVIETLHHYVEREAEGGGFIGRPSAALSHGVCYAKDDKFREDRASLLDARGLPSPHFVGIEQAYFGIALATVKDEDAFRCVAGADNRYAGGEEAGSLFNAELQFNSATIAPQATQTFDTVVFAGPKRPGFLEAAGHGFVDLIDLGFFGFIAGGMNQLLGLIVGFVGNWGLAIILLTFVVKLVLYPLTAASFQSMARMRLLKPEMDALNEKYKNDPEAKGQQMMALYKKHGINPVAGCLPSLAQMPIWFALYQSLSTNVELFHAPFIGYVTDLSAPDQYFVMPLILGALMFVQQKMTPQAMDPAQAKIMLYLMPTMITVFMLFLPAGLCLYMLTNSTLGIAQQKFIQWRLDRQVAAAGPTDVTSASSPEATSAEASTTAPKNKGDRRGRP